MRFKMRSIPVFLFRKEKEEEEGKKFIFSRQKKNRKRNKINHLGFSRRKIMKFLC